MKIKKYMILYIDQDYLRVLKEADQRPEAPTGNVYHQETEEYQFKPYIGVLTEDNKTYAVPMTSAKTHKHKDLPDVSENGILVYKCIDIREAPNSTNPKVLADLEPDHQFFKDHPEIKEEDKQYYKKWITNVCDIRKMIPAPKGTYQRVDFKVNSKDDLRTKRRKNLLKTQYFGLQDKKENIEKLASEIYNRQMDYGIIGSKEPDIANLEIASEIWVEYQDKNYRDYKDSMLGDMMYNKPKNQSPKDFFQKNYGVDRPDNFFDYTEKHYHNKPTSKFTQFLEDTYGVDNIQDAIEVFKQDEAEWQEHNDFNY